MVCSRILLPVQNMEADFQEIFNYVVSQNVSVENSSGKRGSGLYLRKRAECCSSLCTSFIHAFFYILQDTFVNFPVKPCTCIVRLIVKSLRHFDFVVNNVVFLLYFLVDMLIYKNVLYCIKG